MIKRGRDSAALLCGCCQWLIDPSSGGIVSNFCKIRNQMNHLHMSVMNALLVRIRRTSDFSIQYSILDECSSTKPPFAIPTLPDSIIMASAGTLCSRGPKTRVAKKLCKAYVGSER